MNRRTRIVIGLILISILAFASTAMASIAPAPAYLELGETRTVDGDYSEWVTQADNPDNNVNDWFAAMYKAANPNFPQLSSLYLSYDCQTQIMYALVLVEGDGTALLNSNGEEHYVKIGSTTLVDEGYGNDGTVPDFNYIVDGPDIIGWEASFSLAEGSYNNLNVHTQAYDDDDNLQTSAVEDRSVDLTVTCGSVGDYVWFDTGENGENGIQDEPPSAGVSNTPVELFKGSDDNVNDSPRLTDTTDSNGNYLFDDLPPGDYRVCFDITNQATLRYTTSDDQDSNIDPDPGSSTYGCTEVFSLGIGEDDMTRDAGLLSGPTAIALASASTAAGSISLVWVAAALALALLTGVVLPRRRHNL
jgi:hypothetical protein